eukprot:6067075-Amphidinium_carterae.1
MRPKESDAMLSKESSPPPKQRSGMLGISRNTHERDWRTNIQARENVGIGKRWNHSPGPKSTPKQ